MSNDLMEKLEEISGRLKEHLRQASLLSEEAQTILNQVNDSIQEMHQNTQPDPDLAGPEPVEPSPGSEANGADPVVAFVAASIDRQA